MRRLLVVFTLSLLVATAADATPPRTLSYQAVLTDNMGTVVPDGDYPITFRLYNAVSGGSLLWSELQNVSVTGGRFDVVLGSSTSLAGLSFNDPYWLALQVDTDPEMTPRTELTGTPYSFIARNVEDGSITSGKIANGTVVRSLNGLDDNVNIVAGSNVTVTPVGNDIQISASTGGGNPPGVASERGISNVALTGVGTTDNIVSRTIDVPAAGFVFVIGSVTLFVSHTAGNPTFATVGTSDVSTSIPSNQDMIVQLPFSAPTGLYTFPLTTHGLYSVSAGDNTFYLLGEKGNPGTVTVSDIQLSLVYVETAYGFVQPTIVTDPSLSDDPFPVGGSVSSGDGTAAAADPVARELADLRARLAKLEAQLEDE